MNVQLPYVSNPVLKEKDSYTILNNFVGEANWVLIPLGFKIEIIHYAILDSSTDQRGEQFHPRFVIELYSIDTGDRFNTGESRAVSLFAGYDCNDPDSYVYTVYNPSQTSQNNSRANEPRDPVEHSVRKFMEAIRTNAFTRSDTPTRPEKTCQFRRIINTAYSYHVPADEVRAYRKCIHSLFSIELPVESGIRDSYRITINHMIDIQKRFSIITYYTLLADYCNTNHVLLPFLACLILESVVIK